MYSTFKIKNTDWTEKNLRYVLCFFPLIGVCIGLLMCTTAFLMNHWGVGRTLQAVLFTVIPVLVTGGIHVDGYMDVSDARCSYGEREKKLSILSDPHIGAFAVIRVVIYFLLIFGLMSELKTENMIFIAIGYVYSRALSGYGVVTLKCAKLEGMLYTFAKGAELRKVRIVMILWCIACTVAFLFCQFSSGLICVIAGIASFVYYRTFAKREFGGITGDLAGWFLQNCELLILICVVGMQVIRGML